MNKYNLNPIIKDFLERNNAYKAFIANCENQGRNEDDIKFLNNHCQESSWLAEAFIWYITPEGEDYWVNLAKKFNYLITLEKDI